MTAATPFSYRAYGLGIHSELFLPGLVADNTAADVMVRLGEVGHQEKRPARQAAWLEFPEAAFRIRAGREIVGCPTSGTDSRLVPLLLLGPAFAMLLLQRGLLLLHASTVEVGGGAVAFMGASGHGKSTTAAVLHRRGHAIVADDLTAIDLTDPAVPRVVPGPPQLKLTPQAAAAIGIEPNKLISLHPDFPEGVLRELRDAPLASLPLRRIYVLEYGVEHRTERMGPQDSLLTLLANLHTLLANRRVSQDQHGKAAHFRGCSHVTRSVPVHRLVRPRSLTELSKLARFVEDDLT